MIIQITDFNNASNLLAGHLSSHWNDISDTLTSMPLHLKASDQAGLQGNAIFDPVGTNEHIKFKLGARPGWKANVPIPDKYKFLGTDVDFLRDGVLVEVQFSNYPFLLNNLLRSELFLQSKTALGIAPIEVVVIITKARMFPASNSTLYYEQAKLQLTALATERVFDAPMRLVGLFEKDGSTVQATWTEYHNSRYSRTVVNRTQRTVSILPPRTSKGRSIIV